MADLVSGDTGALFIATCTNKESGSIINLTGASVNLQWINSAGTPVVRAMTIVDAAAGVAQYQFLSGDNQLPAMNVEVSITDATGFVITNPETLFLSVREQLA